MYIGKLGDGSAPDDGIYTLIKEVIDNAVDEYVMGNAKIIEITLDEKEVCVRDYGRGIPLGRVIDVVSKINTGGKYDSRVFRKSVGLNGVGLKAVNALSINFKASSIRDGKRNEIFGDLRFRTDYIAQMLKNYACLNPGLVLMFNSKKFFFQKWLKRPIETGNK